MATGTIFDQLAAQPGSQSGKPPGATGAPAANTATPAPGGATPGKTGTIFDDLVANPSLGMPAPAREPGQFGPYDENSEGHIFMGPMDKGLNEGIAHGFGLKSPNEGLGDVLKDTWSNLVSGAKDTFQKIADYKAPPGTKTAFDTEGFLSGRVPAALMLTPVSMAASGIEGTASLLEQGSAVVKDSIGKGGIDRQKFGQGVGMILSSLAQVAMGMEGSEETEKVAQKTGAAMEERAPRAGNSLLRATNERNYLYGKNPGRAFIDEPIHITNSITKIADDLSAAGDRLHEAVDEKLNAPAIAQKTIDVATPLQQVFGNALEDVRTQHGLRNRGGVIAAIKTLEDDVLNEHDIEGNTVAGATSAEMSPAEVNDLKKSVGKNTKWDTIPGSVDPEISGYLDGVRKQVYGTLNDLVDKAAPGVKALNARYANVIEASRLIAKRIAKEEMADLGGRRLLSRGAWLYALDSLMHGEPIKAGTVAAVQAARSTVGRTMRPAMMDAAGKALQAPGSLARSAAGVAAATAPGVSGQAGREMSADEPAFRMLAGGQ